MAKLAVFDLDGTLTTSNAVDADCFVEAVSEELGFLIDSDWSIYEHCTDAGIAAEALARRFGRPATSPEMDRLRATFRRLLETRLAQQPELCTEVPGAAHLLSNLHKQGWHACIATGAWSMSAELKRNAAGLPRDIAIFSSDIHPFRETIVATAIEAMRRANAVTHYERIVSVGDGVWDVATALRLGVAFLGVGAGDPAQRLVQAGAGAVVPDFASLETTLAHLESAEPPCVAGRA